ncbi:chromogranin A [Rhinolophus ferrumequinum]|uniref:Chromogranin-A n=1 Tax=Rhinolophus ferrumequinum TaxID=59479 RepID=A0A7J7XNQ5_RHIFE|nr:chromogranin-A [Rhinolophus ferrumequinum]KAF6350986.1 chromogranin A [Rhinolophus ferrumequinum]
MRSAAVLALLLCAGQVTALPVNSPMNKGDTEVMKCIVEVISDTLSKPSPMPVSQECVETLRGDERILSILRHQNLLKELQDLALQGAKERAHEQKKHSSFEDELSEVLEKHNSQAELKEGTEEMPFKDAAEKRGDANEMETNAEDTDGARPQVSPEPGQGSEVEEDNPAPGEEAAANTHPPASLPSQRHPGPQVEGDSEGPSQDLVDKEKSLGAEQGQQARREEDEEAAEAGEKAVPEEDGPTAVLNPHPSRGYKETQSGWSEAMAVDGAGKTGAEEAQPPKGKGEREWSRQEEEEMAEAPQGLFRGGKSGPLEQEEEERLSEEWEDAKRWSKMDQLANELTAEKRLDREDEEDDPDRSMKLSFRAQGYGFRGPGMQLRRGWRPSSREDSVEAGLPLQARGYPEEKKEEEGSANRRPEDQELESLSAIEAELEKVAHQLQALRRG